MTHPVDALTIADADDLADLDDYAFIADPFRAERERDREELRFDQAFGVRGPDVPLRGGYLFFDLGLAQPGPLGTIAAHPVSGLSWVAVHPDHRRRGVLSAMIDHHLRDARHRGYAWSGLTATETAIYGRFGYAVASLDVTYTLGRGTELAAPAHLQRQADDVQVTTLLTLDDDAVAARLRAVEEANLETVLGTLLMPREKSRAALRDIPARRRDGEPQRALLARSGDADVGFAIYQRERKWNDGQPHGKVKVHHLTYRDDGVALALARRLVDMDLMSSVELEGRSLDDPLVWWTRGPRDISATARDALWLRPVDVELALGQRGYATALDVVLEVSDTLLPEVAGRFHLRVGADGVAECTRTEQAPHVRCSAGDLGSVHLGLRGWRSLTTGGTVEALDPGVISALDAAFSTGSAPIGGLSF